MNERKSYLLFFVFIIVITRGSAQMMIPVTTTIRTPQGNVPYTTYRYIPGPVYNYYNPANISSRHKFTIELKNDSIIVSPTKIRIDDKHQNYLKVKIKKQERIIRPSDTIYFENDR
jgi:hypothetical protein